MQLTTLLAAAGTFATVIARESAVQLTKDVDFSQPHIRIINRCDYTVNLWSVLKSIGCPTDGMVSLNKGDVYAENFAEAYNENPEEATGDTGVSIKLSRTEQCKGNDIAQVEYYLDNRPQTEAAYAYNYYDMSYVDCASDCPTKQEGFYWTAGDPQIRAEKVTADDSWCPTLKCNDPVSCALISYILPDDIRTKTCSLTANMDVYLCGSQPPSANDNQPASSAPDNLSSKQPEPPKQPEPQPAKAAEPPAPPPPPPPPVEGSPTTSDPGIITPPPIPSPGPWKVKTEVVFVTHYEFVNVKRNENAHAHAHARRHQQFHA